MSPYLREGNLSGSLKELIILSSKFKTSCAVELFIIIGTNIQDEYIIYVYYIYYIYYVNNLTIFQYPREIQK